MIYNQTLSIANTSNTAGVVLHSARIESEANTQPHGQNPTRSVARFAFRFALVAAVSASLIGCGNTYRPVVTAINPVGPASQPTKYAVAISSTGATTPGLAASHSHRQAGMAAAENAYAYVPPASGTVMANGSYLGRDPDMNIRVDLLRQGDQRNVGGGGGN